MAWPKGWVLVSLSNLIIGRPEADSLSRPFARSGLVMRLLASDLPSESESSLEAEL